MHRSALLVLLLAALPGSVASPAQAPQPAAGQPAAAAVPADVPQIVQEAEAAITRSDWKTAQTKLNAYLAHNPADARALFDAGYVADSQELPIDAIALYRRAIAANPRSFEAHVSLGLLLARQGNFDEARPELQAATRLDPGVAGPAMQARAWRALAEIDRKTDPSAASDDLLQALKISPETEADTLMAADLADQTNQNDAAEAAYRRVLAEDPKSTDAAFGLAHILIKKKQYPDAETVVRAALQNAPDDPGLNAQLATVLVAQDKSEALPLLEKLHAAHPGDQDIMGMLAQVRGEAGDTAGSDELLVKLLAASPDDTDLLKAHGQDLLEEHKFADAFAAFARLVQIDPSNGDGWGGVAFAAYKLQKPNVTLHALTMRSRVQPETPFTYYLWASSYDALHDRTQAVVYYHHFLDTSAGKFPDQELEARHRLAAMGK